MKSIKILSVMIVFSISILAGEWTLTGSLNQARSKHCAALLDNSCVLAVGGWGKYPEILSSCEIWDMETGQCTYTDSLPIPLVHFALVKLDLENGTEYLAIGGKTTIEYTNRCFRYNPETRTWRETGSMNKPRVFHSATTFRDTINKLLVMAVGGFDKGNDDSYEIYNPETEEWTIMGYLNERRLEFTLITLSDELSDVILACTGNSNKTAEIWRPTTMSWSYTEPMHRNRYRNARISKISEKKALITGGWSWEEQKYLRSCETFNLESLEFTETDSLEIGRAAHAAILLPNMYILVNGGMNPNNGWYLKSTEIYNLKTSQWSQDSDMNYKRSNHTNNLLHDGRILTVGMILGGPPEEEGATELYSWNHQPSVSQIQCPKNGFVGDTLNICVNVTYADNDSVSVRFFWENEDTTDWSKYQESGHEFEMFHAWPDTGTYHISVQTKDIWETKGEWNKTFTILISDSNDVGICFNPLIPQKSELFQNFPNPFNQLTTINYQVEKDTEVEIIIYNLMGQKVKTLESGFKRAGYYSLQWNGQNKYGKNESSGVYIYQLITPNQTISRKMLFIM